jgi:PEP-CTERM motif
MSLPRGIVASLAALLLATSTPALALLSYNIQIDTSTLLGTTGYLDFQFNPGSVPAPDATATVFNVNGVTFADPVSAPPALDGDATGSLPGTLNLGNSTSLNAYLAPVTFGALFQFTLNLDGAIGNSGSNTAFSLAALDGGFTPRLLADLAGYALLTLDRDPGNGQVAIAVNAANPAGVIVTTVPEPSALALLIAGMGMLTLLTLHRRWR